MSNDLTIVYTPAVSYFKRFEYGNPRYWPANSPEVAKFKAHLTEL